MNNRRYRLDPGSGRLARVSAWALALLALFAQMLFAQMLSAAVITVDRLDSSTDETDGMCALREAIRAANDDLPTGGCPAGSGADTIVLTGNVLLNETHSFHTGLPPVTSKITVRGSRYWISRDSGAPEFRLFKVEPTGDLTLRDIGVQGGGGTAFGKDGGAVHSRGALSLHDCQLSNNIVDTAISSGGAIFSGEDARLEITGSFFSDNEAWTGGAVVNFGSVSVRTSTFVDNKAAAAGGAIQNHGDLAIATSTIAGNRADLPSSPQGFGGAIENGGALRITSTTIARNSARTAGGGLVNIVGSIDILFSTLAENSVSTSVLGVAVYVGGGEVTLTGSLIADSSGQNCWGSGLLDGGNNLADDTTCGTIPATLAGLDNNLGDHGGPTETYRLHSTSNAIDTGGACGLLTDQRGALRKGNCDIGAYEYDADDGYEISGEYGTDDVCFGHHVPLGEVEQHLHTEDPADWVWFQPLAGSTYQITTSDMIGGSDTVLELRRGCTTVLADNDDIDATTRASKVTWSADADDQTDGWDILVRQYSTEAPNRGYHVTVICLNGPCLDCGLNGGPDFVLVGERAVGWREIEACQTITARDTAVEPGAELVLRAGGSVALGNGFKVGAGASLVVEIDPDLQSLRVVP